MGLIEIMPFNRKFTWNNKQENLILARLDRIFVSTDWEAAFPLATVKALFKENSDHCPLLLNTGGNMSFSKKRFRFEKWRLERTDFRPLIIKAWN